MTKTGKNQEIMSKNRIKNVEEWLNKKQFKMSKMKKKIYEITSKIKNLEKMQT